MPARHAISFPSSPYFLLVGPVCVLEHDIVLYYSKFESAYLGQLG